MGRKKKVMRISRPSPVTIMIDQKQLENVECFKYLGSMLTSGVKLNPGQPWKKLHSTRKRLSLPANWTKFEEETSKILRLEHGFVWC